MSRFVVSGKKGRYELWSIGYDPSGPKDRIRSHGTYDTKTEARFEAKRLARIIGNRAFITWDLEE